MLRRYRIALLSVSAFLASPAVADDNGLVMSREENQQVISSGGYNSYQPYEEAEAYREDNYRRAPHSEDGDMGSYVAPKDVIRPSMHSGYGYGYSNNQRIPVRWGH